MFQEKNLLKQAGRSSYRSLFSTFVLSAMLGTASFGSTPFLGAPFTEPGTQINAVDWDNGADGDAYHVGSNANNTNYRTSAVPISTTTDPGKGFAVGVSIAPGDYMAYTTNFTSGGNFDISFRVATANNNGDGTSGRFVHLEIDGVNVTGSVSLPPTASWNAYATGSISSIPITAGAHKLKLVVDTPVGLININWMTIVPHVSVTYYVDPAGNDGNNGTSSATPWQTLAKVTATHFNPGDSVLFKRGGEWHGFLNNLSSGRAGVPITFADYGSGNKPKFWGSDVIPVNSGWTSAGGNVYTRPYAQQVNSVLVNHQFMIDIFNGGTGDGSVARDPSNTPNCWKWSGGVLTISTNGTNPNSDGRQYDACVRDNIICNGDQGSFRFQNHLVFRNLVVDECGSNANPTLGYGIRIEGDGGVTGGLDVLVDSCEVYRYGRHGYAAIDADQITFTNDYCAYPMPNEQTGQTAYVSFGNTGPAASETSVYNNCIAEHQADTWSPGDFEYEAYTGHGGSVKAVTLNNFQSLDSGGNGTGGHMTLDTGGSATVQMHGGVVFSNFIETFGSNVLIDGVKLSGAGAGIDLCGDHGTVQNCTITGSTTNSPYNAIVWDRGDSNVIRFNTIVAGAGAASSFSTIAGATLNSSIGSNCQLYGNILVSNGSAIFTYAGGDSFTAANVKNNIYQNGATFQLNYGTVWNLSQWQGQGYDGGSIQVASPTTALFTNAAGGDYSLKSGSPAIDFVPTSIAHPSTDINGAARPAGSADDAGAYEFGGSGPPPAPVITSASSASGTVGSGFSYQITATNNPTSYGASGLPGGISVNTGNGLISGTPSSAGTSSASVTATNAGGTGSKAVTITISASTGSYNVNAIYTSGSVYSTGGLDSFGNAYLSSELGTTASYNGSSFTFGPANALDGYSNTTVNLPAGSYTTLNMVGTASGGIANSQTFVVHYTDATTQSFTISMHDWTNVSNFAGETIVTTMAHCTHNDGTTVTGSHYLRGYTFALNGKAVASITLPAARGVVALGFAAGGAVSAPVINSALTKSGTVGSALSYTITATNSPTSYNATSLPAGLSVNTSTGAITGTPTTPGIYSVGISATNSGGTGSATLTMTINNTTTAFNINAIFTTGTAVTNGGADSFGNAYESDQLGTSATFDTQSFTFGAANALDGWSNTTVNLPPGNYTTLDMVGSAVGGNVTGKVFTVNYTDGTNSTFTISLHDWESTSLNAGEVKVVTMADHLNTSGASVTPGAFLHGYTFTLNGKSVQSITLPATRQVIALGFAGR